MNWGQKEQNQKQPREKSYVILRLLFCFIFTEI